MPFNCEILYLCWSPNDSLQSSYGTVRDTRCHGRRKVGVLYHFCEWRMIHYWVVALELYVIWAWKIVSRTLELFSNESARSALFSNDHGIIAPPANRLRHWASCALCAVAVCVGCSCGRGVSWIPGLPHLIIYWHKLTYRTCCITLAGCWLVQAVYYCLYYACECF